METKGIGQGSRSGSARRLAACAAATAALTMTMTMGLGRANATGVWEYDDNLEPNPTNWSVYNSSVNSSGQLWSDPATARSPNHSGFLIMFGGPTNWMSFGSQVHISVVYPGATQKSCAARMYISPYQGLRPQKPTIHGQLEVIDVNTWTYVTVQPFDLQPTTNTVAIGPYLPITTPVFIPSRPDIFVRVVLIGNNTYQAAFVDDLTVQCVG